MSYYFQHLAKIIRKASAELAFFFCVVLDLCSFKTSYEEEVQKIIIGKEKVLLQALNFHWHFDVQLIRDMT